MREILIVALVSFIFGALFFEMMKKYVKRPKGYIRIKHHGDGSGGRLVDERKATRRSGAPSAIRSKFDYLFNYGSRKDPPKIDLADVEKSFQPDSKPAPMGTGELQNRYLDLSQVVGNTSSSPVETPVQQPQYPSFSQTPPPSTAPESTMASPFAPSTGYAPVAQPPIQPVSQPPIQPGVQTPAPIAGVPPVKKEEKEHEWKPMGFFDD